MSRVEENASLINKMNTTAEENKSGSYAEMTVFNLGAIATILADISKSLAVLADKAESERA